MRLDKEEVAVRQLDTAIRLLFDGGDVVSVHTLACAAANVFRDILRAQGGEAWQDAMVQSYPGIEQEIRQTLARAKNFFKRADRDPQGELDFDESTNDETIIVATLEYGELLGLGARSGRTMVTTPMSVFQLWYFARDPRVLLASDDHSGVEIITAANRLFPDLGNVPRIEQLAQGAEVLRRREAATSILGPQPLQAVNSAFEGAHQYAPSPTCWSFPKAGQVLSRMNELTTRRTRSRTGNG